MRLALVTLALAFGLILAASDDPDPTTSDEPVSTTSAKPAKATKLPKLPKLPKGSPRKHTNGTKPGNGPSHKPVPTHPLCKSVLLYSQAQCCDANILGILALGCTSSKKKKKKLACLGVLWCWVSLTGDGF